ncbi:polyphosphate kinase 1 [Shewanella basaltis]|uniref:polyphosphate kinase 1 n=1 Tax=Shewanella basaltis TaxID=472183 RepID=UPI00200FB945|nr:polyphosphate kinase 1 [Shewanella basaltis]MCL1113999.1 polyphosphate kinase 1 [Shewanella basaltis]
MSPAKNALFIPKELSWLSFNERVLQEAYDKHVPLIERVRFLGIFSSNMDEFFKVRVASVRRATLLSSLSDTPCTSRELLEQIQQKVIDLQERFDAIYLELMKELVRCNIFLVNELQLNDFHRHWLHKYFNDNLMRHIAPFVLTKHSELIKNINDDATYLCVCLHQGDDKQYAFVEVPTANIPRFIELPSQHKTKVKYLILLDNIIRHCIDQLFKPFFEYTELEVFSMKMTRDAEFDISVELDKTQLEQMSNGLKKRLRAQPVRLVFDREMPEHMLNTLKKQLNISSTECLIPGGRYHSFKDFINFPNLGRKKLQNDKIPALSSAKFNAGANSFEAIGEHDILLNYPYHKFSHFTELVRQAAYDPAVTAIKINLYRVAKNSHIMQSLIDAVKNGKRVTAVIELLARFDEQSNIDWTVRLTEAGVKVHHGIPSLKVHSKLCLISRKEGNETVLYAHIGSGNFNEGTARFYTDFSLFTADQKITQEVKQVFDLLKRPYHKDNFEHLIVSPFNSRQRWLTLIDDEISAARQNKPAAITLKINNLVDDNMVNKLYEASQAGVKIKLLIRGMCSLLPQVKGMSDNIEVLSIVDRFLEHSRVMQFYANGAEKLYIGSSDWMTRNLDERIEVCTPIYDIELKQMITDILHIQFNDNTKARIIEPLQQNHYKPRGNKRKVRSQIAIHHYLTQYEIKQAQRISQKVADNLADVEPEWLEQPLQKKA